MRQEDDTAISPPERAKRRHARPLELDSDDNEEKEDNTLQDDKDYNLISDWVEADKPLEDDLNILVNAWKHFREITKTIKKMKKKKPFLLGLQFGLITI